ncbi:alpha/beta hydrolase family protein [Blastococcus sp. VKM Ac-2987]|uniref:alpha/beta hydrolase family protein n=1 Tax=Blastococcus sp. VKM Ac-2987 TaxID=3004141 RepID=UPI0022AB6FC6|nr:alpha/beta hydrolase [Blastococcus sp. VKM Ac-2987]MCZ2860854.1 alpha/beta hydrolase [Blastococcus sp. VKM Ac-2987]
MPDTDLVIPSAGHTLAATLTLPDGPGPHPAALLIPGSGPVDRNSDHRRLRLGITRDLAGAFVGAGVASLRYDKRGAGASSGDWRAAGLSDNRDDAAAALQAVLRQPGVDAGRVVVVGHSEGAQLAAAVAADEADVAGVVLLSGSATTGRELLLWQAEQIAPTLPAPVRAVMRLLRVDLVAKVAANHRRIEQTTADVVRMGGRRFNAKWHREFLAHDPRHDLARIHVPVLAVTGSKDLQVKPEDLEVIAATVPGPVEVHLVPDLTHVLRRQPGPPSLAAYKRETRRPVDEQVLDLVTSWVSSVPPRSSSAGEPGFLPRDEASS